MTALLDIRGVSHRYDTRQALNDVTLSIDAGEVFGLLGPNGSGKSTLLGLLTGALPVQHGRITMGGAAQLDPSQRAYRRDIGVVFQQPSLDAKLSLRENLGLTATMAGFARAERAAAVAEALAVARLADRADDLVGSLSGGMRRRLDIARALMPRPRVLFLDEPSAGLDEASFRALWTHLEHANRALGVSVVVCTHRPEEAERCARVAVLDAGRLVQVASPALLCASLQADRVVITCADPAAVAARMQAALGLVADVVGDDVHVGCADGHALVPRIFEVVAPGGIRAVAVRRPNLADAFFALTGHGLGGDADEAA